MKSMRLLSALLLPILLGGCLLISPYHGKVVYSRSASIPFQAWTPSASVPLTVQCMKTNRFGPVSSSYGPWVTVTTIPVSSRESLDLEGIGMFSAAESVSLPEGCWYSNSNGWFYTSIRVFQNDDRPFHTVDRDGVSCVLQQIAEGGRWIDWMGKGCTITYRDEPNSPLGYVVIRTSR